MGIESDKLVLDYLSKVGDLAQTSLPAAGRMRLVAQLRSDIDQARDKTSSDSPATVRRILGRIGTPGEVVAAARSSATASAVYAAPEPPPAPRPAPSPPPPPSVPPSAPAPPDRSPAASPAPGTAREAAGVPLLARPSVLDMFIKRAGGAERTTAEQPAPDQPAPERPAPAGVPPIADDIARAGWTGGLILSEFERRPQPPPGPPAEAVAQPEAVPVAEPVAARKGGRRLPLPLRLPLRRPAAVAEPVAEPAPRGKRSLPVGPLEVLAAGVLVAGVVLSNYVLLVAGWLLAYACRGIGRRQSQFAAMGLPGIVLLGALLWFWGRTAGRWGAKLSEAQLGSVLTDDFPVILKVAAVASALYLVWRGVLRRG